MNKKEEMGVSELNLHHKRLKSRYGVYFSLKIDFLSLLLFFAFECIEVFLYSFEYELFCEFLCGQ